jgi:uncharacterized lipoprotein YmbA
MKNVTKFLLGMGLALLAGCGGAGDQYYLLTASGPAPSGGGMGIGVGPVTVAEYVDRSNMIFQTGPQKLEVAETHHWAGDVRKSVASAMASNLGRELGTGNVRTYPWERDEELRYQVSLDIRQFHGNAEGFALLEASWRVYSLPGGQMISAKSGTYREPQVADGFEELAAAQSRALQRMAADIAKGMR